jgi:mercuric ion binding protein
MFIRLIFLCALFVSGLYLTSTVYAKSSVEVQKNLRTAVFDVQNMTCPMCKFTIKKALSLKGTEKVSVDYDNKTATVIFDPNQTNQAALIKAVTNAGYPASTQKNKK